MPDITALENALGVSFKELLLLVQALTHSSYANENPAIAPLSNERLEFLGDAILGMVVAERLYRENPDLTEGQMTRLRAFFVRQETLSQIARAVNLGDYLLLGKGEEVSGGRDKPANLARALEAVIAAVYIDQNYSAAEQLVDRLLGEELQGAVVYGITGDYKSQLQELLQGQGQPAPTYHLVETSGPDHDRVFTVEARLGEKVLATGAGKSKKTAETEAARLALEKMTTSG